MTRSGSPLRGYLKGNKHFANKGDEKTACGRVVVGKVQSLPVTDNWSKVGCMQCKKIKHKPKK